MRKSNPQLHNERRCQILNIAEEMFASQKFHEVLMDEVARRANIAKGTIYNYFRNKQELFFSIIIRKLENLLHLLCERVDHNTDALTTLRRVVIHMYSFLVKYPDFFRIWYREKIRFSAGSGDKIDQMYLQIRELMVRTLERGIGEGIILPEKNLLFKTDLILGIIDAAVIRAQNLTVDEQRAERVQMFEFILTAIGTSKALDLHEIGADLPVTEAVVNE